MASGKAQARKTMVGIAVIGIHVIFGIGLVAGTAVRFVQEQMRTIDTRLIEQEDEPPPKEPPPPPPDFVPPPVAPPPTLDIPLVMGPPSERAIVIPKPVEKPVEQPVAKPQPPPVTVAKFAPGARPGDACPYPSASRRLGEAGSVVLLLYVSSQGRVTETKVENSSGFPRLDETAASCMKRVRFVASTVGGQPVDSWQRIRWTWKLED